MDIVKYELALLFTGGTSTPLWMQSHKCTAVSNILQRPQHCTCKMKHNFPTQLCRAPWTKIGPRKWIQFTWKRNASIHESHL